MNSSLLFTLLNPAVSLIFTAAFLALWRYRRGQPYLLMLAACYLASTLGFALQAFDLPVGRTPTRLLSTTMFIGATLALGIALAWRYRRPPPYAQLLTLAAGGAIAAMWFWFAQPSLAMRVYSINFTIGAMLLVIAFEVFRVPHKSAVDKVLLAMLTLQGVLFFVRTIVTVQLGGLDGQADLHASPYWMIFTFSHAILSMIVVFILTTGAALDIVSDLHDETKTDPLTGLLNRRGFERSARAAMERALTHRFPISLILGDLDHFKSINDTFGHHTGDKVINIFARIMNEVVGGKHPMGRIGGEEFAVFVIGGDAPTAELMAQGLRVGFSSAPTPGRDLGASRRLTASFGVSEWHPGEAYEDLLAKADAALYEAKNSGRDRVRVAPKRQPEVAAAARGRATPVVRRYRDSSSVEK